MRPGYHFRFVRHFQRPLEIIARALHVRIVVATSARMNSARPGIFVLFFQRLLRQLLRALRIPGRQPLLGSHQQLAFHRTRKMQQFRIGLGGKRYLRRPLPLFSHINVADQIAVGIAQAGRIFLKLEPGLRKSRESE